LRRTFRDLPSASPPEKYPRSSVSKAEELVLGDNLSVGCFAISLSPDDDIGRVGIDGDVAAAPIVQVLSKDACFLWEVSGILGEVR
jgi:hypothetical protein